MTPPMTVASPPFALSELATRGQLTKGEDEVPVARPLLPRANLLWPYLRRIDDVRYYSNFGPLVREFERRLAGLWGVADGGAVSVANGTVGLVTALSVTRRPRCDLCVLPSWTFCASAHAVIMAGLTPYFVDVDPNSWHICPHSVLELPRLLRDRVAAVMPVSAFGAPVDLRGWDAFTAETGIPAVLDAAAGVDTLRPGMTPAVVSFHATKPLGIGEGGALVSVDAETIARFRSFANFGFRNGRHAFGSGSNGKLSEYAAAVGLASLDEWSSRRDQWKARQRWYGSALRAVLPDWLDRAAAPSWASSTHVVALPMPAHKVEEFHAARGVGTRRWWGGGCHQHSRFMDAPRAPMPNTEWLAEHAIGLPMAVDLDRAAIERVTGALAAQISAPIAAPACHPWPGGDLPNVPYAEPYDENS